MRMINVEKRINSFELKIENYTFESKKIHGLIGQNGSGKTTLLKIISGILDIDNGEINFGDIGNLEKSIASQKPYIIHDSVYYNLAYPLKVRKVKEYDKEVDKWLEICGLLDKKYQYAPSLSSGEKQKLSFARALIFKPKLVLVDETFANLDPDGVKIFEKIILEIQSKDPITWIIVSHNTDHINKICEEIHFLDKGSFIKEHE